MEEYIQAVILIVVGFFAGVINTLAGGGSLFTLPVLIFLGLPPNIANGTNRIAIVIQSLSGALGYKSKGISNFPFNIYLGISASIGAVIGAQIAIDLDGRLFNRILAIILIVVGGLILMNAKNLTHNLPERLTGKYLLFGIIGFFFIGIYGGFINAGIGIVIMLFLNRINRLSLVKTNASKTAIVFIYSSLALAVFAFNDADRLEIGFIDGLRHKCGCLVGE